jgi:hypothetical protein
VACLIFLAGLAAGVALTLLWVEGDLMRLRILDALEQYGETPSSPGGPDA